MVRVTDIPPAQAIDTLLTRDQIGAMFDAVAPRYDLLNRVLSLGVDRRWRTLAVRDLELQAGERLVDICGGTGDLTREAERQVQGVEAVNVDLSRAMLAHHRGRAARAGREAVCVAGDAMALPLRTGSVAGAIIGFGIRNIPDRLTALQEIHRVLMPGGRLVVLEFGLPKRRLVRGPYLAYLRHVLPMMAAVLSPSPAAYRYLGDSILAFPSPPEFGRLLAQAGFAAVSWRAHSLGIAVRYLAQKGPAAG